MILYLQILVYVCVHAKLLQLCLTLRDPVDCSPPGSSVHGILQARILEWVPIFFSMKAMLLSRFSRVQLFLILWTLACQAPLFMGFSRQEYWSGFPFPFSGDLPNQRIEPMSLTSPVWAGGFLTTWKG